MTTTSRIEGLEASLAVKAPVRVATTANITLSGLQTIDGVLLSEDNRVLVCNQTLGAQNGIYITTTGEWTRAADWNGARDAAKGTRIFVTDGATNGNKIFYVTTNNPITISTTSVVFAAEDTSGFDAISPITQLGDIIYGAAGGSSERLAGNTTTTRKFLSQTGDGSNSAAPSWQGVALSDLPVVTIAKGGTGETVKAAAFDALAPSTTKGDLIVYNGTDNVRVGVGADGAVLVASSAAATGVVWDTVAGGGSVFDDSVFRIQDNSDSTKKLAFETSGISTGTTRTLTVPNASDTIVGATVAQTLTNKTLTSPVISTINNSGTLTLPTSTDTLVGRATTDTLTNKTLTSPTISGGTINATVLQVGGANVLTAASIELNDLNDVDTTGATVDGANYVLQYDSVSSGYLLDTVTGAGEVNTASNVGASGAGVFKQKTGTDLEFKKLVAGSNITITGGTSDITIAGGAGGGASALNDLTDVVITAPSSGQVVKYDGSNWVNTTVSGAFGGSFSDLTEVSRTSFRTPPSGAVEGFFQTFTVPQTDRITFEQSVSSIVDNNATVAILRTAEQTGSHPTAGWVNYGLFVKTNVEAQATTNEWAIGGIIDNYAPAGAGPGGADTENVAGYFQANHYNAGSSWAGAFEANDRDNGGLGGVLWGIENLVRTDRQNSGNDLVVQTFLTRNWGVGTAGRIYAFGLADCDVQSPSNTAQYGFLIGDKATRQAIHGGAFPTVLNGFAVYANGTTGFQDEGSKVVGLQLLGTYSGNAIRIPQASTIGFEATGTITLGYNGTYLSANRGIEVNANSGGAYVSGIGSGGWGIDMQAASLSNGLLRGQAFEIQSGGRLNFKNSSVWIDGVSKRWGGAYTASNGYWLQVTDNTGATIYLQAYRD